MGRLHLVMLLPLLMKSMLDDSPWSFCGILSYERGRGAGERLSRRAPAVVPPRGAPRPCP